MECRSVRFYRKVRANLVFIYLAWFSTKMIENVDNKIGYELACS